MKNYAKALVIIAVVMLSACGTRQAALNDPAPIPVPAGVSMAEVKDAVISGMTNRGWIVNRQEPGLIVADLHLREHFAQVNIEYDTDEVVVRFQDSRNLEYDVVDGERVIHANYNAWILNLTGDIRNELARRS